MLPEVIHRTEVQVEGKALRPLVSFISILSEDTLLEIFNCCRLDIPPGWDHKWWYKLIHTCRRWRHIILGSPTSLQLHLWCTYGKPMKEILKFSPPLPLDVSFAQERQMSTKDEEGALFALQQHHRVRRINLREPALQKLLVVLNKPFPVLEDLTLSSPDPWYCSRLPETFSAPRLRQLELVHVGDIFTQGIPLLASVTGLVSLSLEGIPSLDPLESLPVKYLVSRLSLMPQLEYLSLEFDSSELASSPQSYKSPPEETRKVLLSNLNEVAFRGTCTYLESLVACISAPFLTYFTVHFFPRPTIHLPRLSEFLTGTEELKLPVASLAFTGPKEDKPIVSITLAGSERTAVRFPEDAPFRISFRCRIRLDGQVPIAAQICTALSPLLSEVERLHLNYNSTHWLKGLPRETPREAWFSVLRPFCNVKKLQIDRAMTRELSLALCPEDGPPTEGILPMLRKLSRPHYERFEGMLDPFIAARRAKGQLITKRRRPPNSDSEGEGEESWLDWLAGESDEDGSTELDSDSDLNSE